MSSMNIESVTWRTGGDTVSFSDESTVRSRLGGAVLEDAAGPDEWISGSALVNKRYEVDVEFYSPETFEALAPLIGVEDTLVVKLFNLTAAAGCQYSFPNARLSAIQSEEGHDRIGKWTARFVIRSSDGASEPLNITTF